MDFCLTGLLLGPLFLATLGIPVAPVAICAAASAQLLNALLKLTAMAASDEFEMRSSARLLAQDLRALFVMRLVLLIAGGIGCR